MEDIIKEADYVFTGEGSIDYQTKFGKTPYGVAKVAKKYEKPVIAIAGNIGDDIDELYEEGFTAIFGILSSVTNLETAIQKGKDNVKRTCKNIAYLL